jgi:hypothetical protein
MPANDLPFTLFRQPRSLTGSVGFTSRRKACVSRNAVLRWWLVLAVSMCLRKLEVCDYYKTRFYSSPFVPTAFEPETIGGFVPSPTASRASEGQGPFCPVGATNRDKRPHFCLGWCLQSGQNSLAPLSPSISSRPSHSAHLFLLFLARERGVLAHFFITFVKIFDSPVHPSALKVWGLFFSSSLACIAYFIL